MLRHGQGTCSTHDCIGIGPSLANLGFHGCEVSFLLPMSTTKSVGISEDLEGVE